jgi:peroxiredoxin Q/BCP
VGDAAPRLTLTDDRGERVSLTQFRGRKNVVLIFYPGDNTVGCTKQLCAVRDDASLFARANAEVFGVNPGNRASHVAFKDKYGLTARLLIDPGRTVARQYNAVKKFFNHEVVNRTVVAVDTHGRIRFYRRGMPSTREILASLSTNTE